MYRNHMFFDVQFTCVDTRPLRVLDALTQHPRSEYEPSFSHETTRHIYMYIYIPCIYEFMTCGSIDMWNSRISAKSWSRRGRKIRFYLSDNGPRPQKYTTASWNWWVTLLFFARVTKSINRQKHLPLRWHFWVRGESMKINEKYLPN